MAYFLVPGVIAQRQWPAARLKYVLPITSAEATFHLEAASDHFLHA
ncbi:hypothetical protein [Bradyrhizobium centrosematis]|nr:hypothetical protein [Bradyrhizobium centrosematis]MCS3763424.1 hypothetical protein [Bradyrhizobium centrosematis]MCS3776091.1 hypothetical protein [Bradyrhizobium centrosematis]